MSGLNRTGRKRSFLRALTESEIDLIHDGALQILAQTGVVVHDDEVLVILEEAGYRARYTGLDCDHPVRTLAQVAERSFKRDADGYRSIQLSRRAIDDFRCRPVSRANPQWGNRHHRF